MYKAIKQILILFIGMLLVAGIVVPFATAEPYTTRANGITVHQGNFDAIEPCLITLDNGWATFDNLSEYTLSDSEMSFNGNTLISTKDITAGDTVNLGQAHLVFNNVGHDADGDRIDLILDLNWSYEVPTGVYNVNLLPTVDHVNLLASHTSRQWLQISGALLASDGSSIAIGGFSNGEVANVGINAKVQASFTKTNTQTAATGKYLLNVNDLDNGWWNTAYYPDPTYGKYVESVKLNSGFTDVYFYQNTELWNDNNRIVPKVNINNSTVNAFLAPVDSTFEAEFIAYRGMNTNLFEPQAKNYVTPRKILTGRTLADKEFDFEFINAKGETVVYSTNQLNGAIPFTMPNYGQTGIVYASTNLDPTNPQCRQLTSADLNQQVVIGWVHEIQGTDPSVIYDTDYKPVYATLTSTNTVAEGGPFYGDITFDTSAAPSIYNTARPSVTLTKIDSETNETLEGAKFAFYEPNLDRYAEFNSSNQFTGWIDVPNGSAPPTLTTNAEGKIKAWLAAQNAVIQAIEVQAPQGYILDPTPHEFTLTAYLPGTAYSPEAVEIDLGDITNEPNELVIEGTKLLDGVPAAGYEFELYEAKYITEVELSTDRATVRTPIPISIPKYGNGYQTIERLNINTSQITEDSNIFVHVKYKNEVAIKRGPDSYEVTREETYQITENINPQGNTLFLINYYQPTANIDYIDSIQAYAIVTSDTPASLNLVRTTISQSDGTFVFSPITQTPDGTYTYQIKEVNDGKSGIVYDTHAETITVKVENGVVTPTYDADNAVFNNYHEYPEMPLTGAQGIPALLGCLGLIVVFGSGALVLRSNRKEKDKSDKEY